jgi:hypothetical protein
MARALGNDLILGNMPGRPGGLVLSRTERDKHLHIVGSSGAGKTKFIENLIRQDIRDWRKSKCGMLVIDPHGNLYDNLINWLAWTKFEGPIVPIDLRQSDWVISYNVLRQRQLAAPSVLVENFTEAMAYVWGQSGTNQTPLFAQWAWNIFSALYEKKLTLIEAKHLVDREATRIREAMTSDLKDDASRQDWQFAKTLNAKDFDSQIGSTVRRLRRFITNPTMASMFGLPNVSLDLGRALEEGSIILVNLATEGAKISNQNADLFATLLLSDLWTAGQERGKRDRIKPFYVYVDEFQKFVTPTIAENLDQARGFGLHLTLTHQFPLQLSDRGESGMRVLHSVMENAQSKVVFRLSYEENLRIMAQWLFMGVMDPDEVKLKLYSRKVMDYREELKKGYGFSSSSGKSVGTQHGHASGAGYGGTNVFDDGGTPSSTSQSWSQFSSESSSESESYSESETESQSLMPMLVPIFGEELSHVQYRSLEEQLHRAMAVLFDQKQRQGVARLVGMNAPVSIYTPEVKERPGNKKLTKDFLEKCYTKLSFALTNTEAQKQISERAKTFAETLFKEAVNEPATAKRRIR